MTYGRILVLYLSALYQRKLLYRSLRIVLKSTFFAKIRLYLLAVKMLNNNLAKINV